MKKGSKGKKRKSLVIFEFGGSLRIDFGFYGVWKEDQSGRPVSEPDTTVVLMSPKGPTQTRSDSGTVGVNPEVLGSNDPGTDGQTTDYLSHCTTYVW